MVGGFDAPRAGRPFAGTARFTPIAFLGRGNMGFVYRVRDAETGAEVALKTLHDPTPDEVLQLKQEFRTLADITHHNLVRLYELFVDAHHCFFTMEVVDGVDLVSALREDAPLPRADLHSNVGQALCRVIFVIPYKCGVAVFIGDLRLPGQIAGLLFRNDGENCDEN